MINLLAAYIVAKGLESMEKNSGYSSVSSYDIKQDVVKPSAEDIKTVLKDQRNNIAIANHVKNLHTSLWDHCDRGRREPADNKTQRIVLKHCRENGMTKEQEREVEKIAKENMNDIKPWKRTSDISDSYKLNSNVRFVVIPDDFTLRQQQYLCACLKEYGMDTVVFAKENGKEAFVMSFNAIDIRDRLSPANFIHSFPCDKVSMMMSEQDKHFCRPYESSRRYMELHIKTNGDIHMNLEALKLVLNEMNTDRFSNAVCRLPYGMKLFEQDELVMSNGDSVLNGTEQLSVPDNKEDVIRDDLDL